MWHIFFKKKTFSSGLMYSILSVDATYFFSTLFKGIIRKECQSFTNHGHDKTPPTVFNPLSLWLTLPRDMGVSHTLLPPSITRATLACLWFAQYDVQVILCIQFYRLTQLIFSTLLKGIIRKECQSFTNHGHAKTPPTVFNPLSLWLTLPRNMGVSHTVWPPSITRAILACLWFAQYDVQGDSMYSILSIDATYFFNIT